MPVCVVWCVKIFTFKRVFMCLFSSEGIWNLDPIIELPFLWLLLLSPHWYVSNSIPSHKKMVMVSANVYHISFWVWTCVILLRPQHDGLSRAGFAHLVGCYTLCSAKQTWPNDLGKVCVLQLDRSQSLFYFVPQEKNITVTLAWLFQATIKTTLRRGLANGTNSAPSCSTVPLENENRSQNDSKIILKWFFPFNLSNVPDERHPVELALHHRLQWGDRHEGLAWEVVDHRTCVGWSDNDDDLFIMTFCLSAI